MVGSLESSCRLLCIFQGGSDTKILADLRRSLESFFHWGLDDYPVVVNELWGCHGRQGSKYQEKTDIAKIVRKSQMLISMYFLTIYEISELKVWGT